MKKWLIGGGVLGVLAALVLVGVLVTGALAQEPTPPGSNITPDAAKAAALAAYPGATVLEVELEKENGTLVYEVELDNGVEVMVDASDGTVVAGAEQEDADDVQHESESEAEDDDTAGAENAGEAGDVDAEDDAEGAAEAD